MSQVYTPTATSHGSFTLPSDGDPAVAESVNDALRDLADNALVALNTSASALALALQMINGATGGTYAPAADIIITGPGGIQLTSGADLTISGSSIFSVTGIISINNASVQVLGPISITGDTFTVSEDTTTAFEGSVTIEELVTGHLDVRGNIALGNTSADVMVVEATSEFVSPVTFTAPIEVDQLVVGHVDARGNVTLGSSAADLVTVTGTMTLETVLGFSGEGRIPYRAPVELPTGGATITVEDGEVFIVPTTASGNYTASTSGAGDGDRMRFFCLGAMGASRSILAGSATHTFSSGNTTFSEIIFSSGGWKLANYSSI